MNDITICGSTAVIKNVSCFELGQTLDCGQAFRWREKSSGRWCGIAGGKYIEIYRRGADIVIENTSADDINGFWRNYFDLDRDYGRIIESFSSNDKLYVAAKYGSGIRILNQEPWEALCSFIISQNNNIPRIKGIIDRLCENFGDKTENGFAFPDSHRLAGLEESDLAVLRCGFRAKYILDAARRVSGGEIDLSALKTADYAAACDVLMQIKGVGPKVADCALLYGLSHIEAFPKDVWIKRALAEYFGGEIPECAKEYGGIAQQYIFYYARGTASEKSAETTA